jgi:uncharacterized protein YxjI
LIFKAQIEPFYIERKFMKLCFRQRLFRLLNTYDVTDESGQLVYTLRGEFVPFHHRLHIEDAQHQRVATMEERMFHWRHRFFVDIAKGPQGDLIKELTLFKPIYRLDFLPWTVEGDFWGWDYRIVDHQGNLIARIQKEWFHWGDTYVIDVGYPTDALYCLILVAGIDLCIEQQNTAN